MSLSDGAKEVCQCERWLVVHYSPSWADLDPAPRANSTVGKSQRLHLEMIPLRKSLRGLAEKFGLMHNGEPAIWAMDIAVETLDQTARRLNTRKKRITQWSRSIELSQTYPALTEEGWINVSTGEPERELFEIVVIIPPKQPSESLPHFVARFNKTCRNARMKYLQDLKAKKFETRSPYDDFTWIDRFAQWQSGRKVSEIAPSVKLSSFSRGIKKTAEYIGITPRLSKHNPKHQREH